MSNAIPALLFVGPVRMEYFLLPDGRSYTPVPGGPALYGACGARPWTREGIGLVSRVGKNFSTPLLQQIQRRGLDTSGIRIFSSHPPSLGFHYFETWENSIDWEPVKFLSKHNQPCPPELLEYIPPSRAESSLQPFPETAVRSDDIPEDYRQARAAYIAACHYQSQITVSVALRRNGASILFLSPPEGLLLPSYRPQIRELLHGIDILFMRERSLRVFVGNDWDAPSLSEFISHWGPTIVLLQRDLQGIHAYDSESHKSTFIPFYPTEMKNPLAIGDSFCGGFLAVWRQTFDPVESALAGCVSASLAAEGLGAMYALDRNPGLASARLVSLRRSLQP
jgi:sugar/nucleoside kinase (ribokinase family)